MVKVVVNFGLARGVFLLNITLYFAALAEFISSSCFSSQDDLKAPTSRFEVKLMRRTVDNPKVSG